MDDDAASRGGQVGDQIARKVSMKLVHGIAAGVFALLGVLTLMNVGRMF